ncbi:hypothetical protein PCASD_07773 [Puccinia coronata f. sp. avenae]|uniref:Uncharacterized protein n=1 Tax=Puccinia coronata f. sp. avenae TaxID=200324 RepID=A0A2N5TAG2_9BASI|nr:hypothetical protein PCASD_11626 [Puccinia coronata f. sp. avenae]PLW40562.1 hypothetical protein PCASD_07773 [Puccinia coronata f. sp. avenae]
MRFHPSSTPTIETVDNLYSSTSLCRALGWVQKATNQLAHNINILDGAHQKILVYRASQMCARVIFLPPIVLIAC